MNELLQPVADWFIPYRSQCAMAIIATLLVLYGGDINNAIKRMIAPMHFALRTVIFILVCAFGYGMFTVWLTPILAQQIARLPNVYEAPAVLAFFVVLGAIAQKQRQI